MTTTTTTVFTSLPSRLDQICTGIAAIGLIAMTVSFFLAPSYGEVARIFYLLVLLPALVAAPVWLKGASFSIRHWTFFIVPLAWLAISTLWVDEALANTARSVWYYLKPLLFLTFLFIAVQTVVVRYPQIINQLPKLVIVVAILGAALSLWQYLPNAIESGHWRRLAGASLNNDINVTASLYGINMLFCAFGLTHWHKHWRWPLIVSLLLSLLVALLSRSKVPLICFMLATLWLFIQGVRKPQHSRWIIPCALLGVIAAIAFFYSLDRIPFLDRVSSYSSRLSIWQSAIDKTGIHWLLGRGLGTDMPLEVYNRPYGSHAHNLIIDTFRYGGIVGSLLLIGQIGFVCHCGWRLVRRHTEYLPLVAWFYLGLAFLLTNGQQPMVKPHHIWFFYWIPLALILAIDIKARTGTQSEGK